MNHGLAPGLGVLAILLVASVIVSPWFLVGAGLLMALSALDHLH